MRILLTLDPVFVALREMLSCSISCCTTNRNLGMLVELKISKICCTKFDLA